MVNKHYFIAIQLPQQIRAHLVKWRETNESSLSFKSWVHPLDYHFTLVFLGHVEQEHLQNLKGKMKEELKRHKPFTLTISHFGVFGLQERPRVFWAGVNESLPLISLQKGVYHLCTELGFSLEKRSYSPHLTIARKWQGKQDFALSQFHIKHSLTFDVDAIHLYETNMHQSPKYEIKETWHL
jgi:RNA 2',3'-cyclic 3'-phosphodiesterase